MGPTSGRRVPRETVARRWCAPLPPAQWRSSTQCSSSSTWAAPQTVAGRCSTRPSWPGNPLGPPQTPPTLPKLSRTDTPEIARTGSWWASRRWPRSVARPPPPSAARTAARPLPRPRPVPVSVATLIPAQTQPPVPVPVPTSISVSVSVSATRTTRTRRAPESRNSRPTLASRPTNSCTRTARATKTAVCPDPPPTTGTSFRRKGSSGARRPTLRGPSRRAYRAQSGQLFELELGSFLGTKRPATSRTTRERQWTPASHLSWAHPKLSNSTKTLEFHPPQLAALPVRLRRFLFVCAAKQTNRKQ